MRAGSTATASLVRNLPDVTLACIDTANHALALRAVTLCRRELDFGRTLFLTDRIPDGIGVPNGIDVVAIAPLASRSDYSRFVLKSLVAHVTTPHVLLVQWDGYVVNAGAWDDAFLGADYIGTKWFWHDDAMRVGNGGFSLRSKKLLEALRDPRIVLPIAAAAADTGTSGTAPDAGTGAAAPDAEDVAICRTFRPLLEREYGIRFADEALADRFAFEAAYPVGLPFGFHGLYNFCRVVAPGELAALAQQFSDAIAASPQLAQLIRNCVALAQWAPAAALARRRLAALPADAEARSLLERAEQGLARGPVVGRNDPCPCGSGKRYKLCHGAIGAASPAPSADALAQRGLDAHRRGDVAAAERDYREALARDPGQPLALHYLGVALYQTGRAGDALPLLERAVARVPQEAEFHNNLGLALAALDRNDEAVAAYRAAIALRPGHATAWNNLGLALQAMNRLANAIDAYRHALAEAPAFAHAHWNLALALLARGDYAEGWREYEWRLRLPELGGNAPRSPVPRWFGEDLAGRSLLVTTEQGLGDAIQFVRFASALAGRGARVTVETQAPLATLLATAPGVAEVREPLPAGASVASATPGPPPQGSFDYSIPLLSVPGVLEVGASEIACVVPYLRVDPARRQAWLATIARSTRAPSGKAANFDTTDTGTVCRIGLAWAGSPQHANDRRRSIPLAALAPLLRLPGIAWYSLQKGAGAREIAAVPEASRLVSFELGDDFGDTAALVDALDAVVSVDTSVAHLAGALGKPVFVLLPFAPDWRWGIAGDRTPWYPTARLVRQPATGDWAAAAAALATDLAEAPTDGPGSSRAR